ncbi:MAG: PBP1b-binding outer membrane lipoprotein LpoB [Saprospiraceae bacterium]|jgi:PBP1b-binding outer membrane lipoprotein LpoB
MRSLSLLKRYSTIAALGLILTACWTVETPDVDTTNNEDTTATELQNPPVGVYDNAIFSIPSPIQLGSIIANNGASYDNEMLNKANKADLYATTASQALNLGIYGADLGYTTLYDHQQESLRYMKASRKLADVLGISEAFDDATIAQIERNLDNKDSLLYLISNSYRRADDFLQIRERKHIGALIIVGGWIESIYFAATIGKMEKTKEITNLIGMQKHTLETILDKMLIKYLEEPGVEDLYMDLESIRESFEEINIEYSYSKPVHDKENKTTEITSTTTVDISDEVFNEIGLKIELLRKKIIL